MTQPDAPVKISLGLSKLRKPARPPTTNGVKRAHAALADAADEEGYDHGEPHAVTTFDRAEGGAYDHRKGPGGGKPREPAPLTIAPQGNRDWREASKRRKQRSGLPVNAHIEENTRETEENMEAAEEAAKPARGLTVREKPKTSNGSEAILKGQDEGEANGGDQAKPKDQDEVVATGEAASEAGDQTSSRAKTADEEAMDALLGVTQKSNLVVPAITEDEAFEQDFREAPDMATLQEYAAMPVEQFGAALLRGMGWKDGEGIGSQRGKKAEAFKPVQRRPALLGIGAKEEAAIKEEMGAWGRAAKGSKGAPLTYTPVLLRDKRTGEMLTEDEVEKRREQQKREQYEMEFEEEERRRRREKSARHKGDERDGKHRRREVDDESEEEYRRRKEKERRRREREREESDEERYRRKEKERQRRRGREGNDDSDYHHRDHSRRHDKERDRPRDRRRDDRR